MDTQSAYWNSVADHKTFTHPLELSLLEPFVNKQSCIIDYGCGYGRIVELLINNGFNNVNGYDTSVKLNERGHRGGIRNIAYFSTIETLPIVENTADCFILFAVLTCIPENKNQRRVIDTLFTKLKPGGILYISDYYIQSDFSEVRQYDNNGVFVLPEGAIFRHHSKKWIQSLLHKFTIKKEHLISVQTMNGNTVEAFQLIIQKPIQT
jgi:SAM-dependent methyltransferase